MRLGVPLLAVGGGAFLVPDRMMGVSEVLRPEHAAVANAVGAHQPDLFTRMDR